MDFRFAFHNETATQITGRLMQDTIGQTLLNLYPTAGAAGVLDRYVQAIETGQPQTFEQSYDDGTVSGCFDISVCRWGKDGIVVDVKDTTQLRRAEREKVQQADFYRTVLDNALTSISGFEAVRNETGTIIDFRYTLLNKEALRLIGLKQTEVIGKNLIDLFPSVRQSGQFETNVSIVESGEPQQSELHYKDENNDVWLLASSMPMGNNLFVTYADITKLKQAELAQPQQADLLEQVMNTPPTAIPSKPFSTSA